jgi:hypothetical protein
MNENLVGYLLDALEADERRDVEDYLRTNPDAAGQVELLQQALAPLAADKDGLEPPSGLWVRTLAGVAEYRCRKLPPAPSAPVRAAPAPVRTWWRRADILVAAGILFCLALLVPPGLSYVRHRHDVEACRNNLFGFYTVLNNYSDVHGDFPDIAAAEPPRDVAGMFIPILNEEHPLGSQLSVKCPARGEGQAPLSLSWSDIQALSQAEFDQYKRRLAGCYAYSLGFVDDAGQYHALSPTLDAANNAFLPILADRAPDGVNEGDPNNSPNHAGKGQNVLYIDGHCAFQTTRLAGFERDDIYVNRDHRVEASRDLHDGVLGNSERRARGERSWMRDRNEER